MSSRNGLGVTRPGGRLVVAGAGLEAAVQDAHQPVGQLTQGRVIKSPPQPKKPRVSDLAAYELPVDVLRPGEDNGKTEGYPADFLDPKHYTCPYCGVPASHDSWFTPAQPLKVAEDWDEPLHCLICAERFRHRRPNLRAGSPLR